MASDLDTKTGRKTAPGALAPEPVPEKALIRARPTLVVCAVLVAVAVAWTVVVRIVLDARAVVQDERAITAASSLFRARVSWSKNKLESLAALIGEDPRLKATLATPDEPAAIQDVLDEMRGRIGPNIIAVVNPRGRVLAAAGEPRLAGVNLGGSQLLAQAFDDRGARSSVWGFESRLLSVAARSIRLGEKEMLGVVLVAEEIGPDVFSQIGDASGTIAQLTVSDRKRLELAPEAAGAYEHAKGFAAGSTASFVLGGARFLSLGEDVSERALPARAVWIRRCEAVADETARALLWLPAFAALLYGVFVAWKTRSPRVLT